MKRLFVCLLYASVASAQAQSTPPSSARTRIYSVDDALAQEEITGAQFDHSGNVLLVNQLMAVDKQRRFSFELDANLVELPRSKFRVVRLEGEEHLKLPLESEGAVQLTDPAFSPDQKYVAFLDGRGDTAQLGVYDLKSGRSREFAVTPAEQGTPPTWTPDGKLYLMTEAPERSASAYSTEITKSWHDMETGRRSTASVAGSGKYAKDWDDDIGQTLVLLDPNTGKEHIVGHGEGVRAVTFSPDHRWVATGHQVSEARDPSQLVAGWYFHRQIVVYDLSGMTAPRKVCPTCEADFTSMMWSQDGTKLAFLAKTVEGDGACIYDISSDSAEPLTLEKEVTATQIVWIGNSLAVLEQSGKESHWRLVGKSSVDLSAGFDRADWEAAGATTDGLILVSNGAVWKVTMDGERHLLLAASDGKTNLWQPHGAHIQPITDLTLETTSVDGSAKTVTLLDLISGKSVTVKAPVPDAQIRAVSIQTGRAAFEYHQGNVEILSVADGNGVNSNSPLERTPQGHS